MTIRESMVEIFQGKSDLLTSFPHFPYSIPHLTAIYPLTYEIFLSYTLAGDPVQLVHQPGLGDGAGHPAEVKHESALQGNYSQPDLVVTGVRAGGVCRRTGQAGSADPAFRAIGPRYRAARGIAQPCYGVGGCEDR